MVYCCWGAHNNEQRRKLDDKCFYAYHMCSILFLSVQSLLMCFRSSLTHFVDFVSMVVWLRVGSVSKAWNCLGEPNFINGRTFVILTISVCLPCMGKWMERALLLAGLTTIGHITCSLAWLSCFNSLAVLCYMILPHRWADVVLWADVVFMPMIKANLSFSFGLHIPLVVCCSEIIASENLIQHACIHIYTGYLVTNIYCSNFC